jgi:hypothetical protein
MPVNPLPILIPLLLLWVAIVCFLFRRRKWVGVSFVGLSVVTLPFAILSTGVERQFDEQMPFHLVEIGDYRTVKLTTSRGDRVSGGSSDLVARLRGCTNQTVHVVMKGWYDFGRLRAYQVQSIDGVIP